MVEALVKAASGFSEKVTVLAPQGSKLNAASGKVHLIEIAGACVQQAFITSHRDSKNDVLAGILESARKMAGERDVVLSLSYDCPAFNASGMFPDTTLLHYITMALDELETKKVITRLATETPHQVAFMSDPQAAFFAGDKQVNILPMGIDFSNYLLNLAPKPILGWAGRISPEKDVALAMHVASELHMPLRIIGAVQDKQYWEQCKMEYPSLQFEHIGFMETQAFQRSLGEVSVFLMTSSWLEAFGIVVIEAQACGVPVVCYEGTGSSGIVRHGHTGYVVKRGDKEGFIEAVRLAMQLNREICRTDIESRFNSSVFEQALQAWVKDALTAHYK